MAWHIGDRRAMAAIDVSTDGCTCGSSGSRRQWQRFLRRGRCVSVRGWMAIPIGTSMRTREQPRCGQLVDGHPTTPNGVRLGGFPPAAVFAMQVQDHAEIVHLLAELRMEHRDLDTVIDQLATAIGRDELQLTRLK